MKNQIILMAFIAVGFASKAQIGIGTTTPFSTLEVNGSIATGFRSFTGATTATISDCNLIFTGTSAATITLPTAVGITGRMYTIKNASSNTSVLTVATTASQTIDGTTSQLLSTQNQTLSIVSNGASWNIVGQALPGGNPANWLLGGNTVASMMTLGTRSAYDLPFVTNDVERMRITSAGSLLVGNTTAPNDEVLYVKGGDLNTSPNNLVTLTGNVNGYMQLNIQNENNGNFASSDIVATANNGSSDPNDNTYYIDFGINSYGYISGNSNILNGSNSAYLYSNATEFYVGNGAPGFPLIFFTNSAGGGYGNNTANGTERMRIAANGNIGIGTTATTTYKLNVAGSVNASGGLTSVSDIRMKTNIKDLPYGLNELMSLRPVRYNWKDTTQPGNQIGFIAQEVRKIVPEVVTGDEAIESIGIKYAELIPVLVNAIKEQQQQIDDLKKMVESLKK